MNYSQKVDEFTSRSTGLRRKTTRIWWKDRGREVTSTHRGTENERELPRALALSIAIVLASFIASAAFLKAKRLDQTIRVTGSSKNGSNPI